MNSRELVNMLSFVPTVKYSPPALPAPKTTDAELTEITAVDQELAEADISEGGPYLTIDQASRALSMDWQAIFCFVRDRIGLEPGRNTLKTPQGVLWSGRGNSVEQARLLGVLLEKAGENIRYVEGELGEENAALLIAGMFPERIETTYSAEVPISEPSTVDADV